MSLSQHLAAVHFRIIMAGESAEHAVSMFMGNHMDAGMGMVKEVIDNLSHAKAYLVTSGNHPRLLAYIESLITFYDGILQKGNASGAFPIIRGFIEKTSDPSLSSQIGSQVYNNQGNLLAADPFVPTVTNILAGR